MYKTSQVSLEFGLGVFSSLPNITRYTEFNEFGTNKYKQKIICQSLGPFIYIHSLIILH